MELQKFIESAIRQIIDGVSAAQADAALKRASVNPAIHSAAQATEVLGTTADGVRVLKLSFDVAVTAAESSEAKGGAGVNVAGFSVGGGAGASDRSERVSRIQFMVPIALPDDVGTRKAHDERKEKLHAAVTSGSALTPGQDGAQSWMSV